MRTLLDVMTTPIYLAVVLFESILIPIQIGACLHAFQQERGPAYRLLTLAHLALGALALFLLCDRCFASDSEPRDSWPAIVEAAWALPWSVWLTVESLCALVLAACAWSSRRIDRESLSASAVKEAMDLLPAAVCFCAEDGTVLLANLRMSKLCRAVTGELLTDIGHFWDLVNARGEERDGSVLLRQGEEVFQLERQRLLVDGRPCLQVTAVEVTEQARAVERLHEQQRRLQALQTRLRAYREQITDVLLSEELLETQAFLHDQLGHALLQARYYLEHPDRVEPRELLRSLRLANATLQEEALTESAHTDSWETALAMAEAIGVTVQVEEGEPPRAPRARLLLAQAIRECAANAAKHAGGDRLLLEIEAVQGGWEVCLRNNGRQPESEIREAGGLLSLRRMIDAAGGRMAVQSSPEYCLSLFLPERQSEN